MLMTLQPSFCGRHRLLHTLRYILRRGICSQFASSVEYCSAEKSASVSVLKAITKPANSLQVAPTDLPLRRPQCKRAESPISSKILSPAVFSALIASLRFKGRSHFGAGSAAPSLWREVLVHEISASISVICGCRFRTPDFRPHLRTQDATEVDRRLHRYTQMGKMSY